MEMRMYGMKLLKQTSFFTLLLSVSLAGLSISSNLMATKAQSSSRVFQSTSNQVSSLLVKKTPRLKILAGVHEFSVIQTKDLQNNIRNKFVPKKKVFRTLKARLNDTSTFHIGKHKFEIQPAGFNKTKRIVKLNISVSRTFGTYQQIEEKLGTMNVSGLIHNYDGENVFIANQELVFKDKVGTPKLALQIIGADKILKNTLLSKKKSNSKKVVR